MERIFRNERRECTSKARKIFWLTTIKRDKHSFYSKIWDKKRESIYFSHVIDFMVDESKSYSPEERYKLIESKSPQLCCGWDKGIKSSYIGTVDEGTNADIIRNYIRKQGRPVEQLKLSDF